MVTMMPRKIGLGPNTEMRIDQGIMNAIGQTEIDVMIIGEMIDMTTTDVRIIVGIIEIIRQGTIRDHTRLTNMMMIDEGMMTDMIIVDFMMTEEMIIDDPKDLDNFNIILWVEIILNHKMFDRQCMRREKLME